MRPDPSAISPAWLGVAVEAPKPARPPLSSSAPRMSVLRRRALGRGAARGRTARLASARPVRPDVRGARLFALYLAPTDVSCVAPAAPWPHPGWASSLCCMWAIDRHSHAGALRPRVCAGGPKPALYITALSQYKSQAQSPASDIDVPSGRRRYRIHPRARWNPRALPLVR
jgi:hypothetical protein